MTSALGVAGALNEIGDRSDHLVGMPVLGEDAVLDIDDDERGPRTSGRERCISGGGISWTSDPP